MKEESCGHVVLLSDLATEFLFCFVFFFVGLGVVVCFSYSLVLWPSSSTRGQKE